MSWQVLFAPVTNAVGKPWISIFPAISGAILFPAAFLIGAQWGLVGMAWAWLVSAPLLLIVTARLSAPLIRISLWDVARAMLPGLAPALVMAIGVGFADRALESLDLAAPVQLALLVALGGALYGELLWLLERDTLLEVIRLVRRRKAPEIGRAHV